MFCVVSRILSSLPEADRDSHLSGIIVANHLKRLFANYGDTALHASRNFAVAPRVFPRELILADSVPSRVRRLCSHPWDYPGGRYPLPFSDFLAKLGRVRTFLPSISLGATA